MQSQFVDLADATTPTPTTEQTPPDSTKNIICFKIADESHAGETVTFQQRPAAPGRWRQQFLFPLVALLVASFLACAAAEMVLRLCGYGRNYTNPMGSFFAPDGEIGCHGKPNFTGRFRRTDFDVVVEHDENGFRRSEPNPHVANAHDVYVLGDSFVWGYGIGQHDLLTNQMSRLLACRVHNFGLIGAGTVQEYLIFERHVAEQLRPGDTVVLVFFGNDFGDNVGQHLKGRVFAKIDNGQIQLVPPTPESTLRQWKNWMKDVSCLFNLASFCIDRFQDARSMKNLGDRATRRLPPPEQIRAATSSTSPEVRIAEHYLVALRDACRAKQARFLVVWVPGQSELGEDDVTSTADLSMPEDIACHQTFDRLVRELGIETVDLMAPMVAAKRSGRFDRMTFRHDFHWCPAGHTVAAEVIAAKLQNSGSK